ncbi:helix-turn-helix transcriptional regulator [Psychromonas arctica]|uniref:helix-turn-helix transcriptional regulator n=1 Tax=Psychromonas arctica TaxID=168275 RepID=UPI000403ABDF|nr:AlpA family phage regulatory protein [Psychromonas arctica]
MYEQQIQPLNVIRMLEAAKRFGLAKSSFYDRVSQGLITPPISLGGRAKAYVESEIDTVLKAMISGKTESEIKTLVLDLVQQRQNLA